MDKKKDVGKSALSKQVEEAVGNREIVVRFRDLASLAPQDVGQDVIRAIKCHDQLHPVT